MIETRHGSRWAWAEVDIDAIVHNVAVIRDIVSPAGVWAVVKSDGYGHGAEEVARAALTAGAAGLCVALTSEGVGLRRAGITAPVLVLSEQPPACAADLVTYDLVGTVSTASGIDAIAAAATTSGRSGVPVHLKLDTGMHRVGADPADAAALAARIAACAPALTLGGVFTHLAVADEPTDPYTDLQVSRFDAALAALGLSPPAVHAANSAAALTRPDTRRTFVRAGIAIYGISPGPAVDAAGAVLRPALTLKARVSYVKRLEGGERLSYGLRHTMTTTSNVATVPIGYADGVRRNLSGTGTSVLIGGRRREIVGTITMDQLMVDCGDDDVTIGDEVVLIGRQGEERIRAEDWAATLGTIGYEIVCGISKRVPRRYLAAGAPVGVQRH